MVTKAGFKHVVPGAVGERRSPRVYTHAIVGKNDYAAMLESRGSSYASTNADWFQHSVKESKRTVGEQKYPGDNYLGHLLVTQADIDEAVKRIVDLGGSIEAARAKGIADAQKQIADIRSREGDGLVVLAWSQSASSAAKAVGTWQKRGYLNVHVLTTVRS